MGEFEWFLRDALERGYRVGFVCGSDDHKGRPATANPGRGSFGVNGGLACVFSDRLSRRSLVDALYARRCYGTSGPRIAIEVTAAGQPAGATLDADVPPEIDVEVHGTAAIERIDCFRGCEIVTSYPAEQARSPDLMRVSWAGARNRDRQRMLQWDGSLHIVDGLFGHAEGWAFDSAAEGIDTSTPERVRWRSVTTGDADGVVVPVTGSDTATVRFDTSVIQHETTLGEVRSGPVVVTGPGIDTRLCLEMAPVGVGVDVSAHLSDPAPVPGAHAYWIRVTQVDGAKAWVSPFFVVVRGHLR